MYLLSGLLIEHHQCACFKYILLRTLNSYIHHYYSTVNIARDQAIMLILLTIMLCCSAQNFDLYIMLNSMLKNKICAHNNNYMYIYIYIYIFKGFCVGRSKGKTVLYWPYSTGNASAVLYCQYSKNGVSKPIYPK